MINKYCVNLYCSEDISLIENYAEALDDKTQTWDCHHRLEVQGKFRNTPELLKKCGLYYKVPAWQLVFLTKTEHNKLHNIGKECKIETRQKISKANKGKIPWCKGKHGVYSEETKRKMSEAQKGNTYTKDKLWWNNGSEEVRAYNCPKGFAAGRLTSEEIQNKNSACQHRKSVCQYSKDGNLIKIFDSISKASKELGIQKINIINCCKGKRQTTGGFIWKYVIS